MPAAKSTAVKWRAWKTADKKANPRRVCSTPGCTNVPARVKESVTANGRPRQHVYCEQHAEQ